jgi:SAM-dependent methyltransferase
MQRLRYIAGRSIRRARIVRDTIIRPFLPSPPYRCNVCGRAVRKFLPLPSFYSENLRKAGSPLISTEAETCNVDNYSCPYCCASDRDRLMSLNVQGMLNREEIHDNDTIVDFAPSAPLSAYIRSVTSSTNKRINYRTADLYASNVDDRVDICDMPTYSSNSIALFLCSHVLEHVPDDRKAMRELFRILAPGGCGMLLVPLIIGNEAMDEDPLLTDPMERWRRFGQDDHVRLYSRSEFIRRLEEVGFEVELRDVVHFGKASFGKCGIAERSILYVAHKQRMSA